MRRWQQYLIYEALRLMDSLFPNWQAPKVKPSDFLSDESFSFWVSKENRKGQP